MSILNVWVTPEKALIGVDTAGMFPDGTVRDVCKMMPLVHCNAIIAGRGHSAVMAMVFVGAANLGSFDEIDAALPGLARDAFGSISPHFKDRLFESQTIALVGYSARVGRMVGREFVQSDRGTGFVADDINPYHLAPWAEALNSYPDPKDPAAMANLASAQVRVWRETCRTRGENGLTLGVGGRFVIAEISRSGMQIWRGVPLE